jgi:hypothetical protein
VNHADRGTTSVEQTILSVWLTGAFRVQTSDAWNTYCERECICICSALRVSSVVEVVGLRFTSGY